jgi:hypothetical protein
MTKVGRFEYWHAGEDRWKLLAYGLYGSMVNRALGGYYPDVSIKDGDEPMFTVNSQQLARLLVDVFRDARPLGDIAKVLEGAKAP